MEKEKIIELVLKNINIKGLVFDAVDEMVEPALRKVVESTDNKFDDALMAVYPFLEKEMKALLEAKYDELIAKLKGDEEVEA